MEPLGNTSILPYKQQRIVHTTTTKLDHDVSIRSKHYTFTFFRRRKKRMTTLTFCTSPRGSDAEAWVLHEACWCPSVSGGPELCVILRVKV